VAAVNSTQTDLYSVTSGRSAVWPYVLASIAERPVFGYGREALNRNGLREKVFLGTGEDFGHPHNGYFQFALDNGLVGLIVFLILFVTLLLKSVPLFRRDDPQSTAAGGMALALLASFLIAAVGAQTFYPTALSVGVWCAIGLMMRVSLQQSSAGAAEAPPNREVARITKPPRVRWAAMRLRRDPIVPSCRSESAKRRPLASRGAIRWSSAIGHSRMSRWKAGQAR
jgi:hypothetical protein